MFWNKDKKENISDKARVELIRERLSDHVSTGEKTQFDITHSEEKTGVNEYGEFEFTVTNIARVNYDVTEWADVTEADTDVRTALRRMKDGDITTEPLENTDYWATKS